MEPASSPAEKKRTLRHDLRSLRRALDPERLAAASRAIAAAALASEHFAAARTVVGYVSCDGEPDVAPILDAARARGAVVLLPRLLPGGNLDLVPHAGGSLCGRGAAGIAEPSGAPAEAGALARPAIILAPAVALDVSGYRLGRGGGAYDRLLPALRRLGWWIVGVCHACQVVARLPVEPHDVLVDALLTDAGLLCLRAQRRARRASA